MTHFSFDPRPVAELLSPDRHGGIYLVGWYGSPQIARALLTVFSLALPDGTTHEWHALVPDFEDPMHGTAHRIAPDVYWPCPTNAQWPRKESHAQA